ncbi:hypothetical protein GUJ93_ZPchr0012g19433 [Zizania palustris]|uniref:Uncharacterized protein n=1 Tax=Zizania palustris TaxID=103762 RepID=A0A8J5WQB1_ZIZPA|nr:hypothetical protein GUJ93_ZPchr0012g19433 [Zizania palustris]
MNRRGIIPAAAAGRQFVSTDDDDYSSETAAGVDATDNFSNMPLCDFDLPDDLFELMWQGGLEQQQLAVSRSRLRLSPPPPPPPLHNHHRHDVAPSDEEMTTSLYPIISDHFTTGHLRQPNADGQQRTLPVELQPGTTNLRGEGLGPPPPRAVPRAAAARSAAGPPRAAPGCRAPASAAGPSQPPLRHGSGHRLRRAAGRAAVPRFAVAASRLGPPCAARAPPDWGRRRPPCAPRAAAPQRPGGEEGR